MVGSGSVRFGKAVAAATLAAVALAPAAHAYPGDPMSGCEQGGWLNGTTYCDGPIRPDGMFQRCFYIPPQPNGLSWFPATQGCRILDTNAPDPYPPGTPQHHIE